MFNLNSGVTFSHVYVGAVSDGEFNSLRTQGSTRPLHVWQLIHDAKESVSRQSERTLMAMLKRTGGQFVYDSCFYSLSGWYYSAIVSYTTLQIKHVMI